VSREVGAEIVLEFDFGASLSAAVDAELLGNESSATFLHRKIASCDMTDE